MLRTKLLPLLLLLLLLLLLIHVTTTKHNDNDDNRGVQGFSRTEVSRVFPGQRCPGFFPVGILLKRKRLVLTAPEAHA